jgi:Na+-transporting NADH:ubiquinone oxidoreductase subunit NqrE
MAIQHEQLYTEYLAYKKTVRRRRIFYAASLVLIMILSFFLGMFLAAAYDVSQDITLGQAIQIIAKGE